MRIDDVDVKDFPQEHIVRKDGPGAAKGRRSGGLPRADSD